MPKYYIYKMYQLLIKIKKIDAAECIYLQLNHFTIDVVYD